MGLRRGSDQSGALGPAPPDAAESRLQRAAGPGPGRAGRPLSLRLSLFCIPGTHSHPQGCLQAPPQAPGTTQTLPGPGARGPQGVLATPCHILQGPSPSYWVQLYDSMDCSPPVRLLCPRNSPGKNTEQVAMSSSRGSSCSRDQTWVSCTFCIALQADSFPLSHWLSPKGSSTSCHC